jgi:hypothetical protein
MPIIGPKRKILKRISIVGLDKKSSAYKNAISSCQMDNKNKKIEINLAIAILFPTKMMSPQKNGINDIENRRINSNAIQSFYIFESNKHELLPPYPWEVMATLFTSLYFNSDTIGKSR